MNLNGHYEPSKPGATSLRDARPLWIDGQHVTAEVHDGTVTVFVGLKIAYDGLLPAHVTTPADVHAFAARMAVAYVGPDDEPAADDAATDAPAELTRAEFAEVNDAWHTAMRASDHARDCAYDESAQDCADAAWDAFYGLCNDYSVCASCWAPLTDCPCA